MRELIAQCKEVIVEVFATAVTLVTIFAIAVLAEWAMNQIGDLFGTDLATPAKYVKYALNVFDVYLFCRMVIRIHRRLGEQTK